MFATFLVGCSSSAPARAQEPIISERFDPGRGIGSPQSPYPAPGMAAGGDFPGSSGVPGGIPGADPSPFGGDGSGSASPSPMAGAAGADGGGAGAGGGGAGSPATASGLGGGLSSQGGALNMLGDLGAQFRALQVSVPTAPALPQPFPPPGFPRPPSPRRVTSLAPTVRGFKIGENQSPQPQDRVFYSFNYFSNVNGEVNSRFDSPVGNLRVYRQIFGFEKTFDSARGSFGVRLPLNTLTADSTIRGAFRKPGGTSTALGDVSFFAKYILKLDPATGSLISAGIVVTPPTGPDQFAGATYVQSVRSTTIQPFLGYIWRRGDFYLHGFSALDVPSSVRDVTMVYNDIGIGYYVYRNADASRWLTAVVPTFEVHVNNPLTHRDPFNQNDPAGTPDIVNLTYGLNLEFSQRSILTFGFVNPVTNPKPFDHEWLLLFNVRFGGSRRTLPPVLGG
ncbi:hypothetical protein TA3x_001571 [Tundrisphaera sp. TA3]|uniref:hypothetical protein n=1 Tax=Tundrisphaera sp. TA3 TaxID=3435775 RepID=UPI003EBE524C